MTAQTTIRQKTDIVIKILDILIVLYVLLFLIILIWGGFSFSIFGIKIKAHNLKNPAITLVILFVVRKVMRYRENLQQFLLAKVVIWWGQRLAQWTENHPSFFLGGLVGGYAIGMSIVTVLRHLSYHSQAFDLGIFDQVLWNAVNGNGLYSSIIGQHHFFGEHVSLILLFLAPLYWIYADPKTLLVVQSCALASGAIPLYWLTRKKLESTQFALLLALLYLCYQPLRNVNLYDFHPIAFVTPLLLFAFFYLDQKTYLPFGLFLLLALFCKEEIAFIVFIFGLYIAFIQKNKMLGSLLSLVGITIFVVDIWLIIPYYRKASFGFVHRYNYLGDNIPEMLRTLMLHPIYVMKHVVIPEKIEYILEIFGPLGFLSFLSPSHVLLAAPTFFQNILSDFPLQYSVDYQYTAPLTPFVFISTVFGIRNLLTKIERQRRLKFRVRRNQMLVVLSVILVFLTCYLFYESLPRYHVTDRARLTDALIRLIPPGVPVSAQELYVPHLSHRRQIYLFPKVSDAEYIFLDMVSKFKGPATELEYYNKVSSLLESHYGVLASEDNLVVLKKGYSRLNNDAVPQVHKEGENLLRVDGAVLPSKTGKVDGIARVAREGMDRKGYITYGPYFQLPKGKYLFTMSYTTHNIRAGESIGKWEIGFALKNTLEVVEKGSIIAVEGNDGAIVQEVTIPEIYSDALIEFRCYYYGLGDLVIKKLTIEKLA